MRVWGRERALAALGQHVGIDVGDGNGGGGGVVDFVAVLEQPESDVAGAAGDVEHFPGGR